MRAVVNACEVLAPTGLNWYCSKVEFTFTNFSSFESELLLRKKLEGRRFGREIACVWLALHQYLLYCVSFRSRDDVKGNHTLNRKQDGDQRLKPTLTSVFCHREGPQGVLVEVLGTFITKPFILTNKIEFHFSMQPSL